ncbi:DUF3040 domain-containing protein [Streptomyces sp. NPDC047928]|uniref:DUF3040 domain-containing protein n=1 Tax=unclassified Streptomyces TaxID=2593676 RepID=UPI00371E6771
MASGMDEDRRLAQIEKLLTREDPDLAQRMVALGRQFPDTPADRRDPRGTPEGRGRGDERSEGRGEDGAPGDPGESRVRGRHRARGGECAERRDWRRITAIAAAVVALLGIILTVLLSMPPGSGDDRLPPAGHAPVVTQQFTGHTP